MQTSPLVLIARDFETLTNTGTFTTEALRAQIAAPKLGQGAPAFWAPAQATSTTATPDQYDHALRDHHWPAWESMGAWLLKVTTPQSDRDDFWRSLVTACRANSYPWTLAAIALALPGIKKAVRRALSMADGAVDYTEAEAAAIEGFLHGLATMDLAKTGICGKLCGHAHTAARRCVRELYHEYEEFDIPLEAKSAAIRPGHVDLILADALKAGVLTSLQAKLISLSRLDKVPLTLIAKRSQKQYKHLITERKKGEQKLAQWLGKRA